jgi:hypothetical protein
MAPNVSVEKKLKMTFWSYLMPLSSRKNLGFFEESIINLECRN